MKRRSQSLVLKLSVLFLLTAAASQSQGQSQQDSLYREIARMDSILFTAFNTRNIESFKSMFSADLEFFHDKSGLTDYNHTVNFMQQVSQPGNDLHRELVKETMQVYPVPGYGAIQVGSHRFCHTEAGKKGCGTFKFIHIWQQKNNEWKITRIISYDH